MSNYDEHGNWHPPQDRSPLSGLRGMAAGPQVTRCGWCGGYTRKPCQCPAEVEIERLRAAINQALPFTMTVGQQILMSALGPNRS